MSLLKYLNHPNALEEEEDLDFLTMPSCASLKRTARYYISILFPVEVYFNLQVKELATATTDLADELQSFILNKTLPKSSNVAPVSHILIFFDKDYK